MANPLPLDAAARAALRAKAEAARDASGKKEMYVNDHQFERAAHFRDLERSALAALREACTPDVILALLAAVERGAEDTMEIDAVRACIAIADSVEHTEQTETTKEVARRIGNAIRALLGEPARSRTPTGADHAE